MNRGNKRRQEQLQTRQKFIMYNDKAGVRLFVCLFVFCFVFGFFCFLFGWLVVVFLFFFFFNY